MKKRPKRTRAARAVAGERVPVTRMVRTWRLKSATEIRSRPRATRAPSSSRMSTKSVVVSAHRSGPVVVVHVLHATELPAAAVLGVQAAGVDHVGGVEVLGVVGEQVEAPLGDLEEGGRQRRRRDGPEDAQGPLGVGEGPVEVVGLQGQHEGQRRAHGLALAGGLGVIEAGGAVAGQGHEAGHALGEADPDGARAEVVARPLPRPVQGQVQCPAALVGEERHAPLGEGRDRQQAGSPPGTAASPRRRRRAAPRGPRCRGPVKTRPRWSTTPRCAVLAHGAAAQGVHADEPGAEVVAPLGVGHVGPARRRRGLEHAVVESLDAALLGRVRASAPAARRRRRGSSCSLAAVVAHAEQRLGVGHGPCSGRRP